MMLPPARPCMPMGQLPGGGLPLPGAMQMPAPGMPMPSLGMPNLGTTGPPGPGPCGMPMPRPMTMAPCGGTLPAPRPMMPTMPTMDASMPRPPMGAVIPPPQPGNMRPQMIPAPQQPFNPSLPPRPPGPSLPQQLAQLQAAGQEGQRQAPPPPAFHGDRKPQLFMLIAQLAPHVQESHMQQLLEQCGDLQAFRRAQDAEGKAMSFGVAQFADPESAWKAVTCLAKRRIGGQEIKVLLEENTEAFILKWKMSQKVVFRVNTEARPAE